LVLGDWQRSKCGTRAGQHRRVPGTCIPLITGVPEAGCDASWRVRECFYLAAVAEGGDGEFLDEIGDRRRSGGPVRAAVAGAAELAAPLAGIPGNKTLWITPGTLEALIPGRMQGHGSTEEVPGRAA